RVLHSFPTRRSSDLAEIDPHVEEGKAGIAPLITTFVQATDKRADVRLEHARADDDQAESDIEGRQSMECQGEVSERDDDPADQEDRKSTRLNSSHVA